jgi:hypothetical protein
MATKTSPGPVRLSLSLSNVSVRATLEYDDGSTTPGPTLTALTVRGGQREATTTMIAAGYIPVGRWQSNVSGPPPHLYTRVFRPRRGGKGDS